jgi:hypothetical protein
MMWASAKTGIGDLGPSFSSRVDIFLWDKGMQESRSLTGLTETLF